MSATTTHPDWITTVQRIAELAHAKLPPQWHGRIERATGLVLHEMVDLQNDGTCRVLSSDKTTWYTVNGTCGCTDYERANDSEYFCKHRLAKGIFLKARAALGSSGAQDVPAAPETPCEPSQEPDAPTGRLGASGAIPAEYVVWIQGKAFVKFAGLLKLAHARGLTSLTETWTYNDAELSLAHAVASFEDGGVFAGSGDATPGNVTRKVAPHFRRVALTRAKSRALRDALNVDLVAVEELGDE